MNPTDPPVVRTGLQSFEASSPPPPPAPTSRRPRAVAVAIALLLAAAGTGLGIRARDSGSSTSASGVVATAPSGQPLPTVGSGAPAAPTLDTDAIVARVDPAVVDITTTVDGGRGAGTGMVLTASGLVLTNSHVIEGATRIQAQIGGTGPTRTARVVGYDVTRDVAVIQVEDVSGLTPIAVGDPSTLRVGDPVVAIGNALGAPGAHTVSEGRVEAVDETITAGDVTGRAERLEGLIRVDASLQPGDSGGPLVNGSGQVIGMNTAASVGRRRSATSRVGFAIPIDAALTIARQIQAGEGSATVHIGDRAILGVQVTPTGASGAEGVRVVAVEDAGPAARAGIRPGDAIMAVDGTPVSSVDDLRATLDGHRPGDRVRVNWSSSGSPTRSAPVQLVAGPPG